MLAIKDLVLNKEMTKQAMTKVFGSGHGVGNYLHYHSGRWVRTDFHRHFLGYVKRGYRKYRKYQYHWTWKRVQTAHKGRIVYL